MSTAGVRRKPCVSSSAGLAVAVEGVCAGVVYYRLALRFITAWSACDCGCNDTITSEISFDEFQNKTITEQRLHTPSTSTARLALLKTVVLPSPLRAAWLLHYCPALLCQ